MADVTETTQHSTVIFDVANRCVWVYSGTCAAQVETGTTIGGQR